MARSRWCIAHRVLGLIGMMADEDSEVRDEG